ncbi:MAG: TMEM175 family protein, partial [Vicinamibacterales bacterium]
MKKNRVEAFTDGVFAIVITLLILDLKLPDVSAAELPSALRNLLPSIGAYVLSFGLIGMYWVFHHHSMTLVHEVDGVLLWLNILFLLFISFLPFPTMMMGRYPYETLPVVIYGCNLILANVNGFVMVLYLRRNPGLASASFTDVIYRTQFRMYIIVNSLYAVLVGLAFVTPAVSTAAYALVGVCLVVRSAMYMGIGRCVIGGAPARRDAVSAQLGSAS